MRRYFIAAGTSFLAIGLLFIWHLMGLLEAGPFLLTATVIVAWIGVFYVLFRTGLNRRFADPSLMLPQMAASSLTILSAMYVTDRARTVFLVILTMIFFFGVLRLRTRSLLVCALCIVCGYAAVIVLLLAFKPQTLELRSELQQLVILAVTMPWFAMMGGYISGLRAKLGAALRVAQDNERSLAEAQSLAHLGSWTFDPATGASHWSAEAYRIFGLHPSQPAMVGERFLSLVHVDDRERYTELITKAVRERRGYEAEYRIVLPSKNIRWVHSVAHVTVDEQGRMTLLRGTVMDISERRAAGEQIRQLAHFDALTDLPNRNLLFQILTNALAKSQRRAAALAVLFIDLDGFKQINDRWGHSAGDSLLALFATRLRECLRASDTAARVGGDEFVVLVDDFEHPSNVSAIAKRILLAATTRFHVADHECNVSVSIGIATFPDAGTDIDTLMKNADCAMYSAKRAGKNTYRFWSTAVSPAHPLVQVPRPALVGRL